MKYYIFLLSLVISVAFLNTSIYSQDLLEHVLNPSCGTNSLSQNAPNPFNPLTRINYSIKHESFVSIRIYDMTGRLIKLLVNQNKPPGNYFIKLNAQDAELSSGIYFYRMHAKSSAGEFVETRKLVILK